MKKIIAAMLSVITLAVPLDASASTYSYNMKDNDFLTTLPEGYYESVTIDASSVYNKGVTDGKANAALNTVLNTMIVNPGTLGKFTADNTRAAKTFNESNMSSFTLAVSPVSSWVTFSNWNVTAGDGSLTYTAQWTNVSKEYTSTQTVNIDATGTYRIGCYGGAGTTNGGLGASLMGSFKLTAGSQLRVDVGASSVEGGGGYTGVFVKRPGSSVFYPLMVAGGGANGVSISGGIDGNGSPLDKYLSGGSPRDWYGPGSTSLDQSSAYNASLMASQGNGPLYGETWSGWRYTFFGADYNNGLFYSIFGGGSGWRGGSIGSTVHIEGDTSAGYIGMNSVHYTSTAGSSHYITAAEASAWGLANEYSLLSLDGGARNGRNANVVFTAANSNNARATISLISAD